MISEINEDKEVLSSVSFNYTDISILLSLLDEAEQIINTITEANQLKVFTMARGLNQAQGAFGQWNEIYMCNDGHYMRFDSPAKGVNCTINISIDGYARINTVGRGHDLHNVVPFTLQNIHECIILMFEQTTGADNPNYDKLMLALRDNELADSQTQACA